MSSAIRTTVITSLSLLAALAVVLFFVMPHWANNLIYIFLALVPLLITLGIPLILGSLAFFARSAGAGIVSELAAFVTLVVLCSTVLFPTGYHAAEDVYAQSAVETKPDKGQWDQRGPLVAAQRQAAAAATVDPMARPLDETVRYNADMGNFTSLTEKPNWNNQYRSVVVQKSRLVGLNQATTCTLSDDAKLADGGMFNHNLARAINKESGHLMSRYDSEDIYGYCDGDTPMIVVPLYRTVGFIQRHPVADGVALYNGKTGELDFHEDGKGIPGATYPQRIAESQITSTRATGSFWDWVFNRRGYRPVDEAQTNIIMGRDNHSWYVTKATNANAGTPEDAAVTALPRVRAMQPARGQINPLFIEQLGGKDQAPAWRPNSSIESRIRTDYNNLPNWQDMSVHEIIPVDSRHFVATIGNDQNVRYRVVGTSDLSDLKDKPGAATCLYEGDSTEPLQCGNQANRNGNGPGTQYGPQDGSAHDGQAPQGNATLPAGDLSGLTNDQLVDFAQRALDELKSRK